MCKPTLTYSYTTTQTLAPGLGPTQDGAPQPWLNEHSLMYMHLHIYSYSILNTIDWQRSRLRHPYPHTHM